MDAVRTVENEVRELIRRSRLDSTRDLPEVRQLVQNAVADHDERSLHGGRLALSDLGLTNTPLGNDRSLIEEQQ